MSASGREERAAASRGHLDGHSSGIVPLDVLRMLEALADLRDVTKRAVILEQELCRDGRRASRWTCHKYGSSSRLA